MAGGIIVTELASPAGTPQSGKSVIYPKTDGLWYYKDDAGVEHLLSAPAASQANVDARTANKFLTADLSRISSGSVQATTSGTSKDWTGIPSGVKRVVLNVSGLSLSGTADFLVQIGDATGGLKTTGYESGQTSAGASNSTGGTNIQTGFGGRIGVAASAVSFQMTLTLLDPSDNTWVSSHSGGYHTATPYGITGGGTVALSGSLDRLRLTTSNGTDTLDAGKASATWE